MSGSTAPATLPGRLANGSLEHAELVRALAAEAYRAGVRHDDARRLGEVAFVDVGSRVGETGLVFHNTLFDENAASHIAWDNGIGWAVENVPPDEREAAGLNHSQTHIDFMTGSPARGRGGRRGGERRVRAAPARPPLAAPRLRAGQLFSGSTRA